jgi:hypothetical protein
VRGIKKRAEERDLKAEEIRTILKAFGLRLNRTETDCRISRLNC